MIYLKSPAIQFRLPPENDYHVVEEYCHQACYDYIRGAYEIYALASPEKYDVTEGYTLTDGSFVDRFEAMKIAKATDAVVDMYKDDDMLFSYKVKHYGGPFGNG